MGYLRIKFDHEAQAALLPQSSSLPHAQVCWLALSASYSKLMQLQIRIRVNAACAGDWNLTENLGAGEMGEQEEQLARGLKRAFRPKRKKKIRFIVIGAESRSWDNNISSYSTSKASSNKGQGGKPMDLSLMSSINMSTGSFTVLNRF